MKAEAHAIEQPPASRLAESSSALPTRTSGFEPPQGCIPAPELPQVSQPVSVGAILGVCGLAHAVIDALSAGILWTLWQREMLSLSETQLAFVIYNLLAFGIEPVLGLLVDYSRRPRAAALLGSAVVVGATAIFSRWPISAVVAAGLGNALFHLGAGSICLRLTPGQATAPGIFVAPGAVGLFAGTCLGQAGNFVAWPFVLVLAGLGLALTRTRLPMANAPQSASLREWKWPLVVGALMLACVGVRSLVGWSIAMPWKSAFLLASVAVVAVALGKALGGLLADKWGWGRVAVGALALATPLLAFGANSPGAAIAGLFLFNIPMAITLAGTANLLPGRPAFAFGLTCLALELGMWPVTQPDVGAGVFAEPWMIFGLVFGAATALYAALHTAFLRLPAQFTGVHE